jgi:polysaccharide deacetylase family protein (PEP-CTERM system associated)
VIEDAIGERVLGYRAPSFSITKRSLWALEILAEEGFEYDSSIFPVFHPRYGISGFRSEPVGINLGSGRTIAEFPLTTLKWKKWALPLAGGAYLRLLPKALFEWGWQRLDRLDAPSVLYTHPWEIDFDQPRQLVGWRVRVNHYLNLKRTLSRLSEIVGTCRFATMRESLGALAARGHLPQETLGLLVSGAAA